MTSQESFAARLRARRREVGLSQSDLAGDELSSSYISLIESGKRTPTAAVLDLLAGRLGTTPGFLLEGVERASSDQLDLRLRHAELALHAGSTVQALEDFTAVLASAVPGSAAARESAWGAARAIDAAGRVEEAVASYEELHRELAGHQSGLRWAEVAVALTRCYAGLGDLARAVDLGEAARERLDALGLLESPLGARLLSALVAAHLLRGEEPRAEQLSGSLDRALASAGSAVERASALQVASRAAEDAGDVPGARALAERALGLVRLADDARAYAHLGVVGAWLLLRSQSPDPQRARKLVDAARAHLEADGDELDLAACDVELARVAMADGDLEDAERLLADVVRRIEPTTVVSWRAQVMLGEVLCKRGDVARGRALMLAGTERLESSGLSRMAAEAWRAVADVLAEQGFGDDALDAYRRALALLGITSSAVRPALAAASTTPGEPELASAGRPTP